MTHYPKHEVAISDADRAEIEAIFIELMRERAAAQGGLEIASSSADFSKHPETH
jgi:hypothetical protein